MWNFEHLAQKALGVAPCRSWMRPIFRRISMLLFSAHYSPELGTARADVPLNYR
jgi:hypothetical protein